MYRWQQAGGLRHAGELPNQPSAGQSFDTLCGQRVTVRPRDDIGRGAVCLDPTCEPCNENLMVIMFGSVQKYPVCNTDKVVSCGSL